MGINLKKHNEKAYQKIKDMLKETDRAAVVHPTGTGTHNSNEETIRRIKLYKFYS